MNPLGAKRIAGPTTRVLSLETCRQQCEIVPLETDSDGVSHHPDDNLLLGFLDAAVAHAENFTGRAITLRTFEFALDDFPRTRCTGRGRWPALGIEVPYPPLVEVERFACGEDSESELEVGVDYVIDDYGDKAVLRPLTTWPGLVVVGPNQVTCRYRAGYQSEEDPDSDAPPLPGNIRAAILLMVEHLNRNRGATTEKAMAELPLGVEALLRPDRVLTGMA